MFSSFMRRAAAAGDSHDNGDSDDSSAGSNSTSASNASTSNSSVARWTDAYPCKYYPADDAGCTRPRTCFDCLNVPVNDEECMVNEYGRCVAKNGYTFHQWQDFRAYPPANVEYPHDDQKLQFPAEEATYCDAWSDPMCAACRDTVFADVMAGTANESLTRYCYGEHNCVCVALCEAPWWNSTIGAKVCHGATPSTILNSTKVDAQSGGGHDRSPVQLIFEVIGAVAAVAIIVAVAQVIRHRRRRREEQEAAANSEESSTGENAGGADGAGRGPRQPGPQLSLFGWQAMRSELIEREQLLLAGVEDFSNIRTGYIQLLDVQASAPEEDETVAPGGASGASAPVMLVPLAGASAPPMTPTMPSAPDFDDMSDGFEDDDLDMADL